MKKLLAALTIIVFAAGIAQADIIFYESFGTVTANTSLSAHTTAEGFDNNDLTFTAAIGTPDIRSTANSDGAYSGASGGANVWLPTGTTEGSALDIGSIDTSAYSGPAWTFNLSFGLIQASGAGAENAQTFYVEYSTDGDVFSSLLSFNPTETGWNFYSYQDLELPASETLTLRFGHDREANSGMRLDDVTLEAVPEPGTLGLLALGVLGAFGLRRRLMK